MRFTSVFRAYEGRVSVGARDARATATTSTPQNRVPSAARHLRRPPAAPGSSAVQSRLACRRTAFGATAFGNVGGRPPRRACASTATIDFEPRTTWVSVTRATCNRLWPYRSRDPRIPPSRKPGRTEAPIPQLWGFQVGRVTQHSGYEDNWDAGRCAPLDASFLIQVGRPCRSSHICTAASDGATPEFTDHMVNARPVASNYVPTKGPRAPTSGGQRLRWGR